MSVLFAHRPHRFAVPPGTAQPDRFTLVSIDAFAGRSLDAKRDLYRQIVESLEPLGRCPSSRVLVGASETTRSAVSATLRSTPRRFAARS